jgi:hypothetical protein
MMNYYDDLRKRLKPVRILVTVLITIFCLSLMSAAYGLDAVPIGQEFVLKPGQTIGIQHTKIKIMFDAVLKDNRCPIDLNCVWAGNAEVKLGLGRKSEQTTAIVNTGINDRDVKFRSYLVQLLKLTPQRQKGKAIAQGDYEATFQVSRIKQGRVF